MDRYFNISGLDERFVLFGTGHLVSLLLIVAAVLLVRRYREPLRAPAANRKFRWILAAVLLLSEGSFQVWHVLLGEWTADYSMPLHLCNISLFLSILMLLTNSYRVFEFTYLAGFAGALQALITPDLGHYVYPHYRTFEFFIAHGAVVVAVFFMIFVEGYRPVLKSIGRAFVLLNLTALLVAGINLLVDGNYMFLMRKSANASLLDVLGPWPWYLLVLEGVALVFFLLLYLPFAGQERRAKRNGVQA